MKTVVIVLAIFSFIFIVIWPKKLERLYDIEKELPVTEFDTNREAQISNGELYETYHGHKRLLINSRKALLHRKDKYIFLTEINGMFFSNKENNHVTIKSDYGRAWFEKDILSLENNVLVESSNGYKFNMKTLEYIGEKHSVFSKDSVKVYSKNYYSTGIGFWGNLNKNEYTLSKKVFTKKQLQRNNWLYINASSAKFNSSENKTIFKNQVITKLPNLNLTCKEFEISEKNNIEEFIAKGNVILHTKDRKAKAEKAIIKLLDDKIILAGNAKVESKNDAIGGEEIVIYTDTDKIEVRKAYGTLRN